MLRWWHAAAYATIALAACGPAPAPLEPTMRNVQTTVFDVSCTFSACHQGAGGAAGLDLTPPARGKLLRAATEDPGRALVVPGEPERSFLMDKVLGRNLPAMPVGQRVSVQMPPGAPLEPERLELLRAWIAAGAMDD